MIRYAVKQLSTGLFLPKTDGKPTRSAALVPKSNFGMVRDFDDVHSASDAWQDYAEANKLDPNDWAPVEVVWSQVN